MRPKARKRSWRYRVKSCYGIIVGEWRSTGPRLDIPDGHRVFAVCERAKNRGNRPDKLDRKDVDC